MDYTLDTAWAAGLLFALARSAAFTAASPVFARALPPVGRVMFALAAAIFLARPVNADLGVGELAGFVVVNVVVGLVLAFLTGLVFHLFEIAGEILDVTSGLAMARVLDPITGADAGVFGRIFRTTSFAMFFAIGGEKLVLAGLHRSVDAVGLTGGITIASGLGQAMVRTLGSVMFAAAELSAPAIAALMLAEVALAVASRFSPQLNVFLLGLPAKVLLSMVVVGAVLAVFPQTMQAALDTMVRGFGGVLQILPSG